MLQNRITLGMVCLSLLGITFGMGQIAQASPIPSGFDYFGSNDALGDSLGAYVDLSGVGLGIVPLKGVPFLQDINGDLNIDTIVERKQGIDPFEPPGGVGVIEIELVALHLVSVEPVDLGPLGHTGVFADLHTTINKDGTIPVIPQPDSLNPSIGLMEIRHDHGPQSSDDIGGHFDSAFAQPGDGSPVPSNLLVAGGGVYADAIFTVPGGDPNNPAHVLFSQPGPRVVLSSVDSEWEHTLAGLQVTAIQHDGPHPVEPKVVPEPATLSMFALAGLAILRRRKG